MISMVGVLYNGIRFTTMRTSMLLSTSLMGNIHICTVQFGRSRYLYEANIFELDNTFPNFVIWRLTVQYYNRSPVAQLFASKWRDKSEQCMTRCLISTYQDMSYNGIPEQLFIRSCCSFFTNVQSSKVLHNKLFSSWVSMGQEIWHWLSTSD